MRMQLAEVEAPRQNFLSLESVVSPLYRKEHRWLLNLDRGLNGQSLPSLPIK